MVSLRRYIIKKIITNDMILIVTLTVIMVKFSGISGYFKDIFIRVYFRILNNI